ncbi:MAG: DUF1499 domain-containing protein [Burkholderiales bacterium]
MNLASKLLIGLIVLIVVAAALLLVAGRVGWLEGTPPPDLGVTNGRLKPPSAMANSVSSQAALYPDHPQRGSAEIAPLVYSGDGSAAMQRLAKLLEEWPNTRLVVNRAGYLRAESSTPVLRFTDDLEFWLDTTAGAIQVRSASRLGQLDFGANRKRVEALRAAFSR